MVEGEEEDAEVVETKVEVAKNGSCMFCVIFSSFLDCVNCKSLYI